MLWHLLLLNIAFSFITNVFRLEGDPKVEVEEGPYTRIAMTDSIHVEIFEADTITMVMTACAPECSSCARIYNKEWKEIGQITPPFQSIFPLATMDPQTGQIQWTDNDRWDYKGEGL